MKRVLVTGSTGFTGKYLASALHDRGYQVFGLDFGVTDVPDTVSCDLTDCEAVRQVVAKLQPDYVVHLAALSFVGHGNSEAFYRVNLFGTLNLLEALAKLPNPPRKVLVASSANVYGTPAVDVIDEQVCPAPVNHYANSKLAMEHMVRTWFDSLPIVITRPFNYTGHGQDPCFLIPKIVDHYRRRAPVIELGNLNVSRDFSDVRDVVRAYVDLLESRAQGETVNICSGHGVALQEVVKYMDDLAGYKIEVRKNPAFVRANEIPKLIGNNSKLNGLVGRVPSISLIETLKQMLSV